MYDSRGPESRCWTSEFRGLLPSRMTGGSKKGGRLRKLGWALLAVYALFIGAALYVPGWVERVQNQLDGKPLLPVSEEAIALHKTLTIVDLHSDTLLWKRLSIQGADLQLARRPVPAPGHRRAPA